MPRKVKDPSDNSVWIINDDGSATKEVKEIAPLTSSEPIFNTSASGAGIPSPKAAMAAGIKENVSRPASEQLADVGQGLAGIGTGLATGGSSLPIQIGAGVLGQTLGRQAGSALGGERESLESSGTAAVLGELLGLGMRGVARSGQEVRNFFDIARGNKNIEEVPNSLVRGLLKWYAPEAESTLVNPIGREQVPFTDILSDLKQKNIPLTTSQTTKSIRAAKTEGYNPELSNIRQQQELALTDLAKQDLGFDAALTKAQIGEKAQNLTRDKYTSLHDAAMADIKATVGPLKGAGLINKGIDINRPMEGKARETISNILQRLDPRLAERFNKAQDNLVKLNEFTDILGKRPPEKEVPFILNDSQRFKKYVQLNGKEAGADLLREDLLSEAFDRTTGTVNAAKARQYIHTHEKLDNKFTNTMSSEQRHGINKFIHALETLGNRSEADQLSRIAQLDSRGDGITVGTSILAAPQSAVTARIGSKAGEILFQKKALSKLLSDTRFAYAAAKLTELPKGSPALPSTLRTMLSIAGRMGVPLRVTDSEGDSYPVEFDENGNVKKLEGER